MGRSKIKVTSHKNIADEGLYTLVIAGFFEFDYDGAARVGVRRRVAPDPP